MSWLNFRPRKFNLVVLGSSIEGLACAKEAVRLGARVCIISSDSPEERLRQKSFLTFLRNGAKSAFVLKESISYGWRLSPRSFAFDWTVFSAAASTSAACLATERMEKLSDKQIEHIQSDAIFITKHSVSRKDTHNSNDFVTAENFLIAPDYREELPNIPGAKENAILAKDLIYLKNLNGSVLVVAEGGNLNLLASFNGSQSLFAGSGLELAASLLKIGYDVSLITNNESFQCYDKQMIELYMDSLIICGLKNLSKSVIYRIQRTRENRIEVDYTSLSDLWNSRGVFDHVIFAPKPIVHIKDFNLKEIGIKPEVNENFRVNVPHIYALPKIFGSIVDLEAISVQLGTNLAQHIFGDKRRVLDIYDLVGVIHGIFDYSYVGLTEEDCINHYGEDLVEVYHSYFKPVECYLPQEYNNVLCYLKVICLKGENPKILGMHIFSPSAGNVIQGFVAALKSGMAMNDLLNVVHIFPTVAREFTQLTITKRSGGDPKPNVCCS